VVPVLLADMDDPESTLHAKRELTPAGQKGSELSGGQQVRKRTSFAMPFYTKNDHFAKTGSGQT
jgi:hypothetical protein